MKPVRLGVIFGGQSSEYSVSLHSAGSFLRNLRADQYDLIKIGISPEGRFYIYVGSIEDLEHDHWKEHAHEAAWMHEAILDLETGTKYPLDVVFPILHGKNGEDGSIQGMMEMLNIRCVGCDVLGSAICMDKEIMHILCDEAGIPAAPYLCLKEGETQPSFEEIVKELPLPWVVKPCNAGSSYGVHFVEDKAQYEEALKDAFFYDGRGKALVEKAIDGFEIGCAVLGTPEGPIAGSVDEIQTDAPVFDFDGKYAMKDSAIYCPARIDEAHFENARALALDVFKALNCIDLARVDMFMCKDGSIILNEVNTIPGFTDTSRYPTMMDKAGVSFPDLIDRLIEQALNKRVGVC